MKRFTYLLDIWYSFPTNHKLYTNYEKWLDEHGMNGWELVESKPYDEGDLGDLECTFKQEINISGLRDA